MIVQIVLVIVTAVQVNSQEMCPSVCQCHRENATCKNVFSDVTNMTQHTFHSGLRRLLVTGGTNLDLEEDLFLRWNITSLTSLDLARNYISKIWQRAFYSLVDLRNLNLSGNNITTLHSQTFYNNTRLVRLSLAKNSITDLHPSTFLRNVRLHQIYMYGNKITLLHPYLFKNIVELETVNLAENRIIAIHPSTFLNNSALRYLDISRNQITFIHPDTFIHNKELNFLHLDGNNITEISNTLFRGLEQLEDLDFSNNKIEELNPLVFYNIFTSTNRQNHQVSKLKRLNLAHNMIRSFNFELYFPMSNNFDISNPKFQLEYLNVSSNRLTTLDVTSMKWLYHTTTVTNLTANPWNCDCSVLHEVWRGLKHKLTLHCASPRELQGKTWDVIEVFCSPVGGPSAVTTTLIVTGVLLIFAIGGGLILAIVVKGRRIKRKTPEYCDVLPPSASHISVHSYAEVGAGSSHVTVKSYSGVVRNLHTTQLIPTQM